MQYLVLWGSPAARFRGGSEQNADYKPYSSRVSSNLNLSTSLAWSALALRNLLLHRFKLGVDLSLLAL